MTQKSKAFAIRIVGWLVLLAAGASAPAAAHEAGLSEIDLRVTRSGMELKWTLTRSDLPGTPRSGGDDLAAVAASAFRLVGVGMPEGPVTSGFRNVPGDALLVHTFFDVSADRVQKGRLEFSLLGRLDSAHRSLLTVRAADGRVLESRLLSWRSPEIELEAVLSVTHEDNGTRLAAAGATAVEGFRHVLGGFDHLAFLLLLLLPITLRGRVPAPSLRKTLIGVAGVVTAFTVAHSLTLALAVNGWVSLPDKPVEIAIAGSVLIAALVNLRPEPRPGTWLLAFAFGLIHGFGFAGALVAILGAGSSVLGTLLAFNFGVEIGQLAVVALVVPILLVASGSLLYRCRPVPGVSLVAACVAASWLLERSLG